MNVIYKYYLRMVLSHIGGAYDQYETKNHINALHTHMLHIRSHNRYKIKK